MEPKEKQERIALLKGRRDMMLSLASGINLIRGTVDQIMKRDQRFGKELESRIVKPLITVSSNINKALVHELNQLEYNEQENWLVLRAAQLVFMKIKSGEIQLSTYEYVSQSLLVPCYPLLTTEDKGILLLIDIDGTLIDPWYQNTISLTGDGWANVLEFLLRVKSNFTEEEWHNLIVNCENLVKDYE